MHVHIQRNAPLPDVIPYQSANVFRPRNIRYDDRRGAGVDDWHVPPRIGRHFTLVGLLFALTWCTIDPRWSGIRQSATDRLDEFLTSTLDPRTPGNRLPEEVGVVGVHPFLEQGEHQAAAVHDPGMGSAGDARVECAVGARWLGRDVIHAWRWADRGLRPQMTYRAMWDGRLDLGGVPVPALLP